MQENLGMDLDYSKEAIVKVSMINYFNNVLRELTEHLGTPTPFPYTDHICKAKHKGKTNYITKEQA